MTRLPSLTAAIARDPRAVRGYTAGTLALSSAHASPDSVHLCFAAPPVAQLAPGREPVAATALAWESVKSSAIAWVPQTPHRWALVLAGGNGTRLASLTARNGAPATPKQYCSLLGGRSLLGDALARAERLVAPERRVVVVAKEHGPHWRRDLAGFDRERVLVQPRNRGTAAGVLLPLLAIAERDPSAQVTLLPSDHFAADEAGLAVALRAAQDAADAAFDRVILVGVEPDGPEPDYGWIVPGARHGSLRSVRRFVEKPDRATAESLLHAGGVWNTFLLVGNARAFLQLFAATLPELAAAFQSLRPHADPRRAQQLYDAIADADFSRDVLAGSEDRLALLVAPSCGWTDLGTPARVSTCAEWLRADRGATCAPESLGAAAAAATEFTNA